jgi:hypothetical protein
MTEKENQISIELINYALSPWRTWRTYAKYHYLATEEIILTAKAMDFIEAS